ncbi:hypothetical protein N7510_009632 [Penicillium lagena]|uniref:uncharacterized protein n=1 Tax=Penicillium lagena TaxID=94218 RepID=UPI002541C4B4|nr:uncharacterized protein N7510_009632 [Penicillium lagena]KAJ5604478.1 hypothetical protein N7510_009632 [Penicillium lagena]
MKTTLLYAFGIFILIFYFLIIVPILLVVEVLVFPFTLPYTLYHFSSNWSLTSSDEAPVALYLKHFERIHPDLIRYVGAAHETKSSRRPPRHIKFWPRQSRHFFLPIPCIATITYREWTFSHAAGLFATLENVGWDRKLLWTFLRDQVEGAGLVTDAEKDAFAKVMQKMNSHRYTGLIVALWRSWIKSRNVEKVSQNLQRRVNEATDKFGYLGLPIVTVTGDSMNWILQRSAILVLGGVSARPIGRLVLFQPVWKSATKDMDLEEGQGFWQLIY